MGGHENIFLLKHSRAGDTQVTLAVLEASRTIPDGAWRLTRLAMFGEPGQELTRHVP